jgi:hypothetical protein
VSLGSVKPLITQLTSDSWRILATPNQIRPRYIRKYASSFLTRRWIKYPLQRLQKVYNSQLIRTDHPKLVLESELQPLISLLFPTPHVLLISHSLPLLHPLPYPLLPLIQQHEPPPLPQHHHQRQRTDGDQDFVATVVVGRVVRAVDLRPDERPDLHDHVVRRGRERPFSHGQAILTDPGREDGVEVGIWSLAISKSKEQERRCGAERRKRKHFLKRVEASYFDLHPEIIVVSVNLLHACPCAGSASSAARRGRHQNSPIKQ